MKKRIDAGASDSAYLSNPEVTPSASLMRARRIARRLMSYNTAAALSDLFAERVPLPIQRITERYADFPVSSIIRNARLLFIRVPKVASVSLSLQVYGRVSHVPHRSAVFYLRSDPEFFSQILSFAVMRDPLERADSAFRWLKGGQYKIMRPNPQTQRSIEGFESFETFVMKHVLPAFEAGRLHSLDPVLQSQCSYVCDSTGNVIVNRLFRLDRMSEVQRFLADNGVISSEKSENQSPGRRWISKSDEIEQALRIIYAKDIDLFSKL